MPWTPENAPEHTHKAVTEALRRLWAEVANDRLGRGDSEASAIRQANAAVAREAGSDSNVHGGHKWL